LENREEILLSKNFKQINNKKSMLNCKNFLKFFVFALFLFLFVILIPALFHSSLKSSKINDNPKTEVADSNLNPAVLNSDSDYIAELVSSFPFDFSREQIENSLMQNEDYNQEIVISPVEKIWRDNITDALLQKGWKLIGMDMARDGGTVIYYYFRAKDLPALSIYYHWDLFAGEYDEMAINFVHPDRIGSWLLKNQPSSEVGPVDIEALMECTGVLFETSPGITECVTE